METFLSVSRKSVLVVHRESHCVLLTMVSSRVIFVPTTHQKHARRPPVLSIKENTRMSTSMPVLMVLLVIIFQSSAKGEMMLLATDFSSQLTDQIETYLNRFNSIPAFLSSITLELFNRQTQTIVIN